MLIGKTSERVGKVDLRSSRSRDVCRQVVWKGLESGLAEVPSRRVDPRPNTWLSLVDLGRGSWLVGEIEVLRSAVITYH